MKFIKYLILISMLSGCSFIEDAIRIMPAPQPSSETIEAASRNDYYNAPMRYQGGVDHLFLLHKNYDATGAGRAHKENDALGILDWTPGTDLTNLRKFFAVAKRVSLIRIHLINNTCIRNRTCGSYEIGSGYDLGSFDQAVLARNPKIKKFVQDRTAVYKSWRNTEHPNLDIGISPILEGNESDRAYEILADWVKEVWPEVQLVNSHMSNNGQRYRGSWVECHGKGFGGQCDIGSTDGVDVMDIDAAAYITQPGGKVVKVGWSRINNCRDQGARLPDPRARTNCGTASELEQLSHVSDIPPSRPKRTFNCNVEKDRNGNDTFSTKNIWKPLSEDKGTGDGRANLPVLIPSGLRHTGAELVTFNGKKVGTLAYYGKFTDGRPRLYSGQPGGSKKTGYQFEQEAIRLSGNSWVWVKQGPICRGPILPGRRQGEFYK